MGGGAVTRKKGKLPSAYSSTSSSISSLNLGFISSILSRLPDLNLIKILKQVTDKTESEICSRYLIRQERTSLDTQQDRKKLL